LARDRTVDPWRHKSAFLDGARMTVRRFRNETRPPNGVQAEVRHL